MATRRNGVPHPLGAGRLNADLDVGPAKESIEMETVTYTSALRYDESSQTYYREFDSSRPQYVGQPGPAIDHAWHQLLEGMQRLFKY